MALVPLMLSAQRTLTASGTYTHYAPMNVTPSQAEFTAIERAKIDIIERAFGRIVGVKNYTEILNQGEHSTVKFLSLGESEVNGEWIETIGQPSIDHSFADNLQVITVSITGRIREVSVSKVDFDTKILRNGIADRFENSEFKDGDDLFVSFLAPTDGYVAIYLYDLSGVNRLLPMKYSGHPAYYVSADTKYVFLQTECPGMTISPPETIPPSIAIMVLPVRAKVKSTESMSFSPRTNLRQPAMISRKM